jgi:hypothetical protein
MRRRWYILAAAAGGLAAAITWAWPAGPSWTSGREAGRLEGFSPDGRVLVTWSVPDIKDGRFPEPVVSRWDAATGRLLGRVEMPCADPLRVKAVRPSSDGTAALVGEGFPPEPGRLDFGTGRWYLHDAVSGRRRTGPIAGLALVPPAAFSPDGRWFWGLRGEPDKGFQGLAGIGIFSADTGELVLAPPTRNDQTAGSCLFAPDGDTVAVWRVEKDKPRETARHTIQVVELPAGRERRRVDLPTRSWIRADKWDGRYFEAVADAPGDSSGEVRRRHAFDFTKDPVGKGVEDPLLVETPSSDVSGPVYWLAGPGWAARFTIVRPDSPGPVGTWWSRVATRLGTGREPHRGPGVTARFVDRATGATRYELPRVVGHPCVVSPDGRRLACAGDGESVEVWDTDPSLRWPWALVLGVAAAGCVLGIGSLRGRHVRAGRGSVGGAGTAPS